MVFGLEQRNRELERQLEELLRENTALVSRYEAALSESERLEGELERAERERQRLELSLEKLRRLLFGRKSEKLAPRDDGLVQLELLEEAKRELEEEKAGEPIALGDEAETETIAYERKKRRGGRKPILADLPRQRVVIDVDPELRVCPDCGEALGCIGEDIREELEYIPALLFVVEYVLKKYGCKSCQRGVVQERFPERPIKKGRPGPGLLAHILVSKYHDHLPLHRLEQIFSRHGLEISRKTLSDWVQAMGVALEPVVQAMKTELFASPLLQADETHVEVKHPEVEGKTHRGYVWTYGIPGGEVVYDFALSRSGAEAKRFLSGYRGYLQSDAYSGYNALFLQGVNVHIGCWAHARRKIFEGRGEDPEIADLLLASIQKLYRIEREAKKEGLRGAALIERRRGQALPILERIRELIDSAASRHLPKSAIGEALAYVRREWEALVRYVEVPEAEIDNNAAERSMRRVVLGRKNWLFVGHPKAGPRVAVILSVIETCRRLGVEPYAYLREVIAELARAPERAPELTPRAWLERRRRALETSENPPQGSVG
jgi:transposase